MFNYFFKSRNAYFFNVVFNFRDIFLTSDIFYFELDKLMFCANNLIEIIIALRKNVDVFMVKNSIRGKTPINSFDFTHEAYQSWVSDIFKTIETAKLQTSLKVNADLLKLYYTIGREILYKQDNQVWGKQVIDLLSIDLQRRFKGESGYSIRKIYTSYRKRN